MKSYFGLIKAAFARFNGRIKRTIGGRYVLTWIDEIFSLIVFGASPDDYFRYEFFRKAWHERNKFLTYRRSKRIIKKFNSSDAEQMRMFNDKALMNSRFKDYLSREWIDLDAATDDGFSEFAAKHERIILKPKGGSGGHGIFVLNNSELPKSVTKYGGYIAEQLLVQHPAFASLNASSVNSLRVMTFKGEVISCVLKIGAGNAVVDNMCSNGMYGNVNLEYGITDSLFFDINLNKYAYHPQSGAMLLGVEIPHWDKIKALVAEASTLLTAEYIGWDIAVLPDGPAIIEANEAPGHDLSCQSTVQCGIFEKIKAIEKRS